MRYDRPSLCFLSGRRGRTRAHLTRSTGTIATAVTTVIVIAVAVVAIVELSMEPERFSLGETVPMLLLLLLPPLLLIEAVEGVLPSRSFSN